MSRSVKSIKFKTMFFAFGLLAGLWISWPGVVKSNGWICIAKLLQQSRIHKTPLKAFLALPPKYFLNGRSYKGPIGKVRILGDACFR